MAVQSVAKRIPSWWQRLSLSNLVSGALWILGVGALSVTFVLWSRQHFAPPPVTFLTGPVLAGEMIVAFAYASVGWLLASIRPKNPIGWLFLGMGVVTAIQLPVTLLVADAERASATVPSLTLIGAWLASSAHLPIVGILGIWAFLVFPDGRLLGRRWALAGVVATIGAAAVSVAIALSPGGLLWYPSLDNTFATAPAAATSDLLIIGIAGGLLFVVGLLAAGVSIIVRYRRSGERGRLQLRWIAFAVVLLTVTAAPFLLVRYVLAVPYDIASVLAGVLVLTAGAFPLTAAIAILRYRLLDIDLILNRTIVYVPLSAILAGLFGALATLVQRVFVAVTGDTSDIAIVLATVMVALTVTPLQRALQELADHYVKPADKPPGATQATAAPERTGAVDAPTAPAELDATLHRIVAELEELEERIEELEPKRPAPRSTSHRSRSEESQNSSSSS